MRRILALVIAFGLLAGPVSADICSFGYTGMMNSEHSGTYLVTTDYVNQIFDHYNLSMDTVTSHFAANTETLDITYGLDNHILTRGAKAILDLSRMLFFRQEGATTCTGYGGASVTGKDVAYSDWQARLDTWINQNAADLVPSKVRMIVINAEANNSCASQGVIDQIAYHIKQTRGISIPLAQGLPTTYVNGSYHAQPLPTLQPWWIDYIITCPTESGTQPAQPSSQRQRDLQPQRGLLQPLQPV